MSDMFQVLMMMAVPVTLFWILRRHNLRDARVSTTSDRAVTEFVIRSSQHQDAAAPREHP